MPDQPVVRAGQVWADADPRNEGRTLKVLSIQGGIAACEILTNSRNQQERLDEAARGQGLSWYKPIDRRGKTTTISVSRFRPTSTGYRLVSYGCASPGACMPPLHLQPEAVGAVQQGGEWVFTCEHGRAHFLCSDGAWEPVQTAEEIADRLGVTEAAR